jgi:hypothetical protein
VSEPEAAPIPGAVQVGPHVYAVDTSENARAALRAERMRGECRSDQLLIHIDPDLPRTIVQETVLHEVLHAVIDTTVMGELFDHDQIEKIVEGIAPLLLLVLRDNPTLGRYLTD